MKTLEDRTTWINTIPNLVKKEEIKRWIALPLLNDDTYKVEILDANGDKISIKVSIQDCEG